MTRMRIDWATHWELRDLPDDDDAVVWLDIKAADACWQKDNLYIPPGAPDHRGKYDRFGRWVKDPPVPVEMPHVAVAENGSLSFTNGRHRFAWVRDHGARAIPCTIWRGQARRLVKLAGTTLRLCEVRSPAG